MSKKQIQYYDSLRGDKKDYSSYVARKERYCNYVLQFLKVKYESTFNDPFNVNDWKFVDLKNTPQQSNGSNDCGVAVLMFIEAIMKSDRVADVKLTIENTSAYRQRILQIIECDYKSDTVNVIR